MKFFFFFNRWLCFFFKVHQRHRSFSWAYVEPPSKCTSASKDVWLDEDAIEFETSEIVQQQKKWSNKSIKSRSAVYIILMVKFVWYNSLIYTWINHACFKSLFYYFNTYKKFPKCRIFFPIQTRGLFPKYLEKALQTVCFSGAMPIFSLTSGFKHAWKVIENWICLKKYWKILKCLEKSLNSTIYRRIQHCLWRSKSVKNCCTK